MGNRTVEGQRNAALGDGRATASNETVEGICGYDLEPHVIDMIEV